MIEHVAAHTIPAAMSLLPNRMDSPGATAMLLAIGLQESRFIHRRQVRGPAMGFWQFEESGGVKGVLTHYASRGIAAQVCGALQYEPQMAPVYTAIKHNDTLACAFARLLLWTHPKALPARSETDSAWSYYMDLWRPGKPHPDTFPAFFEEAWAIVEKGN